MTVELLFNLLPAFGFACWCFLSLGTWRERKQLQTERLRYETASTLLGVTSLAVTGTGSSPVALANGDTLRLNLSNGSIDITTTSSTTLTVTTTL